MTSHHLVPVLLFFLSIFTNQCMGKCHVNDEAALLAFKAGITKDPSGMLSSWKSGTDCCTWSGVECRFNHRVTYVSLYGQEDNPKSYLSGTISSSLSKLLGLEGFYLQRLRNITGLFPKFLYTLPNLSYVYIDNCKLSGPIPSDIGQKLFKLSVLSLHDNRFSGSIPASISQMTQLTDLVLGGNALTGPIPNGPIPLLIPDSLSALAPRLTYLELSHNALTGKIPSYMGNFKALDTLDLSSNKLTGLVPGTLKNLTKIFNLNLARNQLVGPFPQLKVRGIESLDLSYNKFKLGTIPKWVQTSPIIYSLKLAGCGLKFRLKDFKPTETYFYDFNDLSDNQISGSLITLLNQTTLLKEFRAAGNLLLFNMSKLIIPTTLKYLDLSRNQVFGKVPKSISGLKKLDLSSNHLCGRIPPTTFAAEAFRGNDCLCGSPMPKCKK